MNEIMKQIHYNEHIRSHNPKSIIYWVTEGIIIDGKRYPIEEFRLKDDGLYAVVSKNDREYFEVFLNKYDDSEILSQLEELNKRITDEEHKVDKDTTYTAGNGLILSGTKFSIDDTMLATKTELNDTNIRLTAEEQKVDKDTTYTAGNGLILSGTKFSIDDTMSEIYNNALADHAEIANARGTYNTLAERLNKTDDNQRQTTTQLAQTVKKDDTLSMANMGQDIKEAMTGGSVAVVGRDMVGKENIKKASVTAGKLAFTKRGFNLFDGEYKEGVALDLSTEPMSLTISPGRMTAIIPVEGGKTYHYQGYDDTDRLAIAATKEYPNFSKNIGESLVDYDLVKFVNTAKVYRKLVVPVDANFLVINVSGAYREPELQLSEKSGFRTGYDRRINPSNGGAGTVANVNSHFGINFRYKSNEIIINDLTFVAFGYRYSIPYTTIPMMNGYVNNILICYNLTTEQLVQYESLNTLKVPDDVVILGSYTKKDVTPISINGFSNYQINDTNVHNSNYAKNGLLVSRKGRLNFDFARGKIITTGNTQVMLNGRSYLIPPQELDISGASTTETSCLYADVSKLDVVLKYNTLYTMQLSPNQIPLGTFFPLDGTVTGIEHYLINGVDPKKNAVVGSNFNLKIGGIGQIDADITSADGYELTLASIKSLRRRQPYKDSGSQKITQMPVGYLYHAPSKSGLTDLYYSANQADKPKKNRKHVIRVRV